MDYLHRKRERPPLPKDLQVSIFRRDRWLCYWCDRPVVFAPVMRYLEGFARQQGYTGPLAYFHHNWRRDKAPLLDHLAAVVDHKEAYSRGGAHEKSNLVTACNKCNMRKSSEKEKEFKRRSPKRPVKGKYGEPVDWDGLSTLFLLLIDRDPTSATETDADWHKALRGSS